MTWINTAPLIAGAATLLFALSYALRSGSAVSGRWVWPALLSLAFFGYTLYAGLNAGGLGFWTEHVRNLWGNQIWFDLLLGVGTAVFLLIPKAKSLGINPLPWVILTIATGSIGLLVFLTYVLWKGQVHDTTGPGR